MRNNSTHHRSLILLPIVLAGSAFVLLSLIEYGTRAITTTDLDVQLVSESNSLKISLTGRTRPDFLWVGASWELILIAPEGFDQDILLQFDKHPSIPLGKVASEQFDYLERPHRIRFFLDHDKTNIRMLSPLPDLPQLVRIQHGDSYVVWKIEVPRR